jgi:hypothetical protein
MERPHAPPVTTGDARRRLVCLMVLIEELATQCQEYLDARHGRDCDCRFCRAEVYAPFAADDVRGLLWAAQAVETSLGCGLYHFDIVDRRVTVEYRKLTRAEVMARVDRDVMGEDEPAPAPSRCRPRRHCASV